MDDEPIIQYLNTDLDLVSTVPLTALAKELELLGMFTHVTAGDDGLWYARGDFSNDNEPEVNIVQLLDALDRLSPVSLDVLHSCSKCEFNIGYDCGDEPWAFNQGISNETLRRIAEHGASLRITLYPFRRRDSGKGSR